MFVAFLAPSERYERDEHGAVLKDDEGHEVSTGYDGAPFWIGKVIERAGARLFMQWYRTEGVANKDIMGHGFDHVCYAQQYIVSQGVSTRPAYFPGLARHLLILSCIAYSHGFLPAFPSQTIGEGRRKRTYNVRGHVDLDDVVVVSYDLKFRQDKRLTVSIAKAIRDSLHRIRESTEALRSRDAAAMDDFLNGISEDDEPEPS